MYAGGGKARSVSSGAGVMGWRARSSSVVATYGAWYSPRIASRGPPRQAHRAGLRQACGWQCGVRPRRRMAVACGGPVARMDGSAVACASGKGTDTEGSTRPRPPSFRCCDGSGETARRDSHERWRSTYPRVATNAPDRSPSSGTFTRTVAKWRARARSSTHPAAARPMPRPPGVGHDRDLGKAAVRIEQPGHV
jgi:hypothetical protein